MLFYNNQWNDQNDQDGKRPSEITIHSLANGEEIDSRKLTEKEEWKTAFTDLPEYKDGQLITYSVTEDEVKDYTQANEQTQRFLMIIGMVIVAIALTIWSVLFYKRQQQ